MSNNTGFVSSNKNSHIESRVDSRGNLRTETTRRDCGLEFAITTDDRNNSTRLFIDYLPLSNNGTISLSGHEARSLFRLLRKHYKFTGKPRKG